jgi:hypothetical protein
MARSRRVVQEEIWKDGNRKVVFGYLKPLSRRKPDVENLFLFVGEKLPFDCLGKVRRYVRDRSPNRSGVYMAHDSFGVPRYGGRGRIFRRLMARQKKHPKELAYFSFYIVKHKSHERELENAILRAAGPQMLLNTLKVRSGAKPGSVRDYEPGTHFFQRKDGRKPRTRQATRSRWSRQSK